MGSDINKCFIRSRACQLKQRRYRCGNLLPYNSKTLRGSQK
jgi:hypothetical protein